MIVRIDIDDALVARCEYRVTHEGEMLYDDSGLDSVLEALVAAVEGLPPAVVGAEIAYRGVVSGTYPLQVIAMNPGQIGEHAVNTTAAIEEALQAG
jgi:hypothetical protein